MGMRRALVERLIRFCSILDVSRPPPAGKRQMQLCFIISMLVSNFLDQFLDQFHIMVLFECCVDAVGREPPTVFSDEKGEAVFGTRPHYPIKTDNAKIECTSIHGISVRSDAIR
jgi:hypothetical protein